MGKLISEKFKEWEKECEDRFNTLKANEEELNRIFIDIYCSGVKPIVIALWAEFNGLGGIGIYLNQS